MGDGRARHRRGGHGRRPTHISSGICGFLGVAQLPGTRRPGIFRRPAGGPSTIRLRRYPAENRSVKLCCASPRPLAPLRSDGDPSRSCRVAIIPFHFPVTALVASPHRLHVILSRLAGVEVAGPQSENFAWPDVRLFRRPPAAFRARHAHLLRATTTLNSPICDNGITA